MMEWCKGTIFPKVQKPEIVLVIFQRKSIEPIVFHQYNVKDKLYTLEVYWDCVGWSEGWVDAHEMKVLQVRSARPSLVVVLAELVDELCDRHLALIKAPIAVYFTAEGDTSIVGPEGVPQGRTVRDQVP